MPLSWNEIKSYALALSKEWENTERSERIWMDFLNVFEITRRRIENFEPGAKSGRWLHSFVVEWYDARRN